MHKSILEPKICLQSQNKFCLSPCGSSRWKSYKITVVCSKQNILNFEISRNHWPLFVVIYELFSISQKRSILILENYSFIFTMRMNVLNNRTCRILHALNIGIVYIIFLFYFFFCLIKDYKNSVLQALLNQTLEIPCMNSMPHYINLTNASITWLLVSNVFSIK